MILDLSRFMDEHPGGKFSHNHNIGRDVSKLFYGSYSLENEYKVQEHVHSNDARRVVNKLVVAKLNGDAKVRLMSVSNSSEWTDANTNGTAKTFKFADED